jgi:hypothetical protein
MSSIQIVDRSGTVTLRAETQQEATARAAAKVVIDAATAKANANDAKVKELAVIAAKYAKDPTKNPALTARQQHELLARLALSIAADD